MNVTKYNPFRSIGFTHTSQFLLSPVPPTTQKFIFDLIHRHRHRIWSDEWITQSTIHNVGNIIATLFTLLESLQGTLQKKELFLIHKIFTYLHQTLRMSQELFRTPNITPELISLSDCAHSVVHMFSSEAKKQKISLVIDIAPHIFVYGHYNIAQQMLINLLKNSFDAFENSHSKQKTITLSLTSDSKKICFMIMDTAKGMTQEEIPFFIQPGFSTKNMGLGLGLTYVHWHTRRTFRAKIKITPNTPQGLTITLHFPQPPEIATIAPCEHPG